MTSWSTGLFSCFEDMGSALYSFMCPGFAMATAKSHVDGSNWWINGILSHIIPCFAAPVFRNV